MNKPLRGQVCRQGIKLSEFWRGNLQFLYSAIALKERGLDDNMQTQQIQAY